MTKGQQTKGKRTTREWFNSPEERVAMIELAGNVFRSSADMFKAGLQSAVANPNMSMVMGMISLAAAEKMKIMNPTITQLTMSATLGAWGVSMGREVINAIPVLGKLTKGSDAGLFKSNVHTFSMVENESGVWELPSRRMLPQLKG